MDKRTTPARLAREKRDAEIRALYRAEPELPQRDIADRFGVSVGTVNRAINKVVPTAEPKPLTADEEAVAELVEHPECDVLDLGPEDFTVTVAEADFGELMVIANDWHAKAQGAYLVAAWHAGHALLAAKAQLGHGQWLPHLQSYFHGSRQTAADYMRIAGAGDSPENVVRSLHLDETPQPSINAATKALAGGTRNGGSSRGNGTAAKQSRTVRTNALRKVRAAADYVRTEASKALGTMTQDEADEYAEELKGYLEVLDQYYDMVNHIALADVHEAAS